MANLSNINNKFIVTDGGQALVNQTAAGFNPDADDLIVGNLSGNTGITIASGPSAGNYGSIYFADGAGSSTASKAGYIRYEQNTSKMTIGINAVEKIAIDISGNTTIEGTVQVNGSNATVINASDPNVTVSDTDTNYRGSMRWLTSSNVLEFFTRYAGTYYTNNLVLDRGKVAIGSQTANKLFNLADPAQGGETLKLHFEAFSATDKWAIYAYDRTNGHYANMSFGENVINIDASTKTSTFAGNVIIHNTSNAPFIDFVESGATTDSKARITMDQIDTNNGSLLFSTEGSGTLTERMKIDQFGQMFYFGQMRLELAATETNPVVGTNCAFMFQNTSNTDGNLAVIDFRNSTGFVTGRIGAQFLDAGDRNTDLYFMTRANGGALTERMRIKSDGVITFSKTANTTTPVASINHASNDFVYFSGGASGGSFGDDSHSTRMISFDSDYLRFDTAGSEKVRILSGGNVGLGNTIPYSRLDLNGVLSIGPAELDPSFTVTNTGLSTIAGGSLEIVQGFGGTSATGDTIVFTYKAESWKAYQFEYCISAAYGLSKGGGGGYNNNGMTSYYYVTTNQGSNVNVTSVSSNSGGSSGQYVVVTITGIFGIHPCVSFKYKQSGGDGAPRADRATLAFNS